MKLERNVGGLDRAIRIIAGAVLIALGIFKNVPYDTLLALLGAFILLSGILGFCILYVPLGISTWR